MKFRIGDRVYFQYQIDRDHIWLGFGKIKKMDHEGYYVSTDVPCNIGAPGWDGDTELYIWEELNDYEVIEHEAVYNSPLYKALR